MIAEQCRRPDIGKEEVRAPHQGAVSKDIKIGAGCRHDSPAFDQVALGHCRRHGFPLRRRGHLTHYRPIRGWTSLLAQVLLRLAVAKKLDNLHKAPESRIVLDGIALRFCLKSQSASPYKVRRRST